VNAYPSKQLSVWFIRSLGYECGDYEEHGLLSYDAV
jgi:hypothetical protein